MNSTVDFSAQFGGEQVAAAVLPHFRSLKASAKDRKLPDFPFPKLAFILRIDGDVSQYGLSGAGNIDPDRRNKYVSVDIGLQDIDLKRANIAAFISAAIESSVDLLASSGDPRLANLDTRSLRAILSDICTDYRSRVNA